MSSNVICMICIQMNILKELFDISQDLLIEGCQKTAVLAFSPKFKVLKSTLLY